MNLLRIPRTVQNIQRFRQIAGIVGEHGFAEVLTRTGIVDRRAARFWRVVRAAERMPLPERFALMLERLGPTFVKLGQLLSTRPDLLPEAWIEALGRLQDDVSPLPFESLRARVEAATGPLSEAFAAFDERPLASASVSQVHAAELPDGRKVVVKIVRPGIRETVTQDVELMRIFAEIFEDRLPELRSFRPTGIVEEFERAIRQEMDLRREARNIARFTRDLADETRIVIPGVIEALSSSDVLVMDRLEGVRVTDWAAVGADPVELADLGVQMILRMIFRHGFFHADPHPGNIWALPGNRLGMLDMGMADIVLPETRDLLIDLLMAVVRDEPSRLAEVVRRLGEAPEDLDEARFRRDLVRIYEEHVRGIRMSELDLGRLIADSVAAARRHRLVIPTDITLLLKALGTVEGVGKQLNPDLDIVAVAQPMASELVGLRWGAGRLAGELVSAAADTWQLAVGLPVRLDRLLGSVERGAFRHRAEILHLRHAAETLEAAGNRQALGLVVLALTLAGATVRDLPWLTWQGWPVATILLLSMAGFLGTTLVVGAWRRGLRRKT